MQTRGSSQRETLVLVSDQWAFMSNRLSPQWESAVFLNFLRSSVCLSVTFLGQMMAKIVIPSTTRAYTFKR